MDTDAILGETLNRITYALKITERNLDLWGYLSGERDAGKLEVREIVTCQRVLLLKGEAQADPLQM